MAWEVSARAARARRLSLDCRRADRIISPASISIRYQFRYHLRVRDGPARDKGRTGVLGCPHRDQDTSRHSSRLRSDELPVGHLGDQPAATWPAGSRVGSSRAAGCTTGWILRGSCCTEHRTDPFRPRSGGTERCALAQPASKGWRARVSSVRTRGSVAVRELGTEAAVRGIRRSPVRGAPGSGHRFRTI